VALVDRLGGGHVPQLGRAIGGGHDEGHLGLERLDDGGVEVGGGGAARAQQHGRAAGGEAEPEGEERRRSLVVVDVEPDPGRRRQGQGQRRGTGPGGDDGVGHAGSDPLVHQRGAERGCGGDRHGS
jgi:hypothetical protein